MHSENTKIAHPSGYLTDTMRTLALSPVQLYRLGLGWLIGMLPILIITTRGRNTHMPRYNPLEYRRHGSKIYVISAWGEQANWYQNLLVFPYATVKIGRRSFSVRASVVDDPSEAVRAIYKFRNSMPLFSYEQIYQPFNTHDDLSNLNKISKMIDQFSLIRLDIVDEPLSLQAVPSDRVWIWWAVLASALLVSILGELLGHSKTRQDTSK